MKRALCAFLLILGNMFISLTCAEAGVVLVLSGGGTRGFAHVGVIEVLEEHGIPVVGIVGTSIGSLVGALSASGYSAAELREVVTGIDLPALLSENASPMYTFSGDDRKSKMNTISGLTYKKSGKRGGPLGMLTGDKLFQYYNQLMHHVDVTDFDELPIPFAAVATSIMDGEKVVLRSGSLTSAMRASMSIPALFEPWEIDGRLLVDGGLVSNLPVNTAKDLFPRFPVIAVDVSDYPSSGRSIGSFIDVLDQSMTITMRRATEEEARRADLVLSPSVQEFPFLDSSSANKIIERGREIALANIEKIAELSAGAPGASERRRRRPASSVIGDVVVHGLPDAVCVELRKQFLRWVGRPFDPEDVENAVKQLMSAPDIATVDYKLQRMEDGRSMVVLNIRSQPEMEFGVSGYATNLHPYRWLYLKGTARGLLSETDSLRGVVRMGDQWGVDLTYLTAPEPLNSWEFNLTAQNWEMDSTAGLRSWERYAIGGQYIFQRGRVRMGLGLAYEHVGSAGELDSIGPTFFAAHDTLDVSGDPTQGQVWRLNAWWPNAEEILYRFSYFKPIQVGKMWRTYLRLGYAEGDTSEKPHAAYFGAAEELYSVARHPIEAERMVWANIAFRRILKRAVWGIVAAEVFGGYGYAMDKNYDRVAAPWEVGLALTIPNNVIDVKVAAMYGSEKFTLGFFLGAPIWDHYPLP